MALVLYTWAINQQEIPWSIYLTVQTYLVRGTLYSYHSPHCILLKELQIGTYTVQ